MIDIHSHIIPYIDDGCRNINDAIDLVKSAEKFGIKKIIVTPHYIKGKYENYKENIETNIRFLNEMFRISNINIEAVCGEEISVCTDLLELLKTDKLCSLNGSRYVLMELPLDVKVPNVSYLIKELVESGYVPVIAHPERYIYLQRSIDDAISYVENGALLQINISSLVGEYGDDVKKVANQLLKHNLIHLWGSDSHSFRNVYDKLDDCFSELEKVVGKEKFNIISKVNPECVFNNKEIKVFDIKYKLGLFN